MVVAGFWRASMIGATLIAQGSRSARQAHPGGEVSGIACMQIIDLSLWV